MDKIDLEIIKLTSEKTVSGEDISSLFNISRTAIWKRIKKLEKLGYDFEHKKEGYRLIKRSPFLLKSEIRPFLKTKFIGSEYIFFEEIDSTNNYAKKTIYKHGAVILAEQQTAGKGRKGRRWVSVKGKGLYFSIVLNPEIPVNELLRFSLLFPLAIHKTIKQEGLDPKIKWPNDIYIKSKKVSGILIETDIEGNDVSRVIVGIGINLNLDYKDLEPVKDIATSLYLEKGKPLDRKQFFINLLENIESNYFLFINNSLDILKEIKGNMIWLNEDVKVIDGKSEIKGKLKGLNKFGGLVLETEKGEINLYSGDLSLRHI